MNFLRTTSYCGEIIGRLVRRLPPGEKNDARNLSRHAFYECPKSVLGDFFGRISLLVLAPRKHHRSLQNNAREVNCLFIKHRKKRLHCFFNDCTSALTTVLSFIQHFRFKNWYEGRHLYLPRIAREPLRVFVNSLRRWKLVAVNA